MHIQPLRPEVPAVEMGIQRCRLTVSSEVDMKDSQSVTFLQWALPKLGMRWPGFRKVRRTVWKRITRRVRELGLADVDAYRAYLESEPAEWAVLDRFCRISISRFYRDRRVFDLLRDEVLPELAQAAVAAGERQLRVWSAGCASGEEPYTLAIIWQLGLPSWSSRLSLSVLATDVDETMLQRAQEGCCPSSSLKDLPKEWVPVAFDQRGDDYCLRPSLRDAVTFQQQDVRQEMPPGPFPLILCRHLVFTYFDEATQDATLDQLCRRLTDNGVLVTGKQEGLPPSAKAKLVPWSPHSGVYRLAMELS